MHTNSHHSVHSSASMSPLVRRICAISLATGLTFSSAALALADQTDAHTANAGDNPTGGTAVEQNQDVQKSISQQIIEEVNATHDADALAELLQRAEQNNNEAQRAQQQTQQLYDDAKAQESETKQTLADAEAKPAEAREALSHAVTQAEEAVTSAQHAEAEAQQAVEAAEHLVVRPAGDTDTELASAAFVVTAAGDDKDATTGKGAGSETGAGAGAAGQDSAGSGQKLATTGASVVGLAAAGGLLAAAGTGLAARGRRKND